ncbi:MAG TPA: aminoglycoside phosphotransferase family protein [Gaiellaceae bacterium]
MVEKPDREKWLAQLPAIVDELASRWSLEIGRPYDVPRAGGVGWAARVRRTDGTKAVLKVNFPHKEAVHEAEALRLIGGEGAAILLESAPELCALLLERLEPGAPLWELPDEQGIPIAAGVLRRMWRPVPEGHPFDRLADYAAEWAAELPSAWGALAAELAASMGDQVLLHQDFHQGNVLSAQREPWLAIDPKPLVGEREFDTASLLRDRSWEIDAGVVRRRFDTLAELLELDRERMRAWGVIQALAWDNPDEAELIAQLTL